MPRVYLKTKSNRGKTHNCSGCGQAIEPGQKFYQWSRRFGRSGATYFKHESCGRPLPSQLSSRKTAQIEDELLGVNLGDWSLDYTGPEDDGDTYDLSELTSQLDAVADTTQGVAEEYSEGADNMPENLQYGEQAEAMRDVAWRLEEWADEMRDFEPDATLELSERDEFDTDDEWKEACEAAFDQWVDDVRDEAQSKLEDMPEYEG